MPEHASTAAPAPPATVEHRSAGRMRVRVGRQHRSPEHLARVRAHLQAHPDVSSVEVNPKTGSVLVRGEDSGGLRAALEECLEVIDEAGPENIQEAGVDSIVILLRGVDRRIMQSTGSRLSLRWLVPASFIAVALRQLLRSGFTVGELPWFVLLYYGVDSFLKLYPHHAPKAPTPRTDTPA
jgi:Heavy metal associated domain 2